MKSQLAKSKTHRLHFRSPAMCLVVLTVSLVTTPLVAEKLQTIDEEAKKKSEARMAEMRSMIEHVEIAVLDENAKTHSTERTDDALLRTIDIGKRNGSEDGSLWLYSHQGIPVAMVELWAIIESHNWGHTLLAISPNQIQGKLADNAWIPPKGSGVKFASVPKTGKPRSKASLRTSQMRQIARRFKCNIEDPDRNNSSDFRLLTEPIHRYQGGDVEDGAIFAFVRGETNPEVLLFIEAKNQQWQFGLLRCSSNELVAQLDRKEVWRAKQVPGWTGEARGPFWVVRRNFESKAKVKP